MTALLARIKTKQLYKKIFILLILLWTVILFVRTLYNLVKLPTQEKKWFIMSEEQKKASYYGDVYSVYKYLNTNVHGSEMIYVNTHEPIAYFLLRYLLFPKKIYQITSVNDIKTNSHYYLLIYNQKNIQGNTAVLTKSFSTFYLFYK